MPLVNVFDYEERARQVLTQPIFDYIAGGAEDEVTLRRNREAWGCIGLRQRVLIDVSYVDTSTDVVLGQPAAFPVLLAPVALQRAAHTSGEQATARAAAAAGTIMVLSTMASCTIEDVAAAADGIRWFQLYVNPDRVVTESLVRRAEACGYSALVLTVDAPYLGRRERDLRNRLEFPVDVTYANLGRDVTLNAQEAGDHASALAASADHLINSAMTWDDFDWLRSFTKLPVLVKGVLAAEDARLAVEHGVSGIIVSNHGGRQLDTALATAEALPEIVEAVQGRADVLVDGGIRRGTDVIKALAMGAKAVLIGRPYFWGLAVDGEQGVSRVLELLKTEFELAMALCGCRSVAEITRSLVRLRPD